MEGPSRNVIVNEDDTRKLDIHYDGEENASPNGLPVMANAGGTLRVLKQDELGNLNVNVQAGGAGGGLSQLQVKNSAGTDTDVGFSAGDMKVPVEVFGAGSSISVNVVAGGAGGGLSQLQVKDSLAADTDVGFSAGDMKVPVEVFGAGGSISVSIAGSSGSLGVYIDTWRQTGAVRVGQVDGTVAVYFSPSRPTVKLEDSSANDLEFVKEADNYNAANHGLVVYGQDGGAPAKYRQILVDTAGHIQADIVGYSSTIGVYVDTIRQTAGVRVGQVDGTVAVYFSQSNPKVNLGTDIVNIGATGVVASNGNSVSGSTSGVSTSGVQIVAPIASRTTKVYAFSIMSTAAVNITAKFTNGSGGSPTELWRVAMISPTGGVAGANLAVTPPGYLFATPSGATLCIVLDSASLVHYSVSYFRESA